MGKDNSFVLPYNEMSRTVPGPDHWASRSIQAREAFPGYCMAAETLHDLHQDRRILETASSMEALQQARETPEPADRRHQQIMIWAMAIVKFHQSPQNRGPGISEIDQVADEYAQMIPSLLGHRTADIEREVWAANKMLDEIEPSLLSIQTNIDLDHIQCLQMSPELQMKHYPDASDEYIENLHNVTVECCRKRADQILGKLESLEGESKRLEEAHKIVFRM